MGKLDGSRLAAFVLIGTLLCLTGCTSGGIERQLTGQAKVAAELVRGLISAGDDASKSRAAIMELLSALRVGVWSGEGELELAGAERSVGDAYLYSSEVTALAASYRGGATTTVADLAKTFSSAVVQGAGNFPPSVVDGEQMAAAIRTGISDAVSSPESESSLPRLIIREISIQSADQVDPAATMKADSTLNPLQSWLLVADAAFAEIAERGPASPEMVATRARVAASSSQPNTLPATITPSLCSLAAPAKKLWPATKWLAPLLRIKIGGAIPVILDTIHMMTISATVRAEPLSYDPQLTHYGHGGNNGDSVKFQIRVSMQYDLGSIAECAWIAYFDLPPVGPVQGVEVTFSNYENQIDKHGELRCVNACVTDSAGVATAIFTPKPELEPASEEVDDDRGQLTATAPLQAKFGNFIGTLFEFALPQSFLMPWRVEWHDAGLTLRYTVHVTSERHLDEKFEFWENKVDDAMDATLTAEVGLTHNGELVNLRDFEDVNIVVSGSGSIVFTDAKWTSKTIHRGQSIDGGWCGYHEDQSLVDRYSGTLMVSKLELKRDKDGNLLPILLQFDVLGDPPGYIVESKTVITEGQCPHRILRTERVPYPAFAIRDVHDSNGIYGVSLEVEGWEPGKPGSGVVATLTHNTSTSEGAGGSLKLVEEKWELRY